MAQLNESFKSTNVNCSTEDESSIVNPKSLTRVTFSFERVDGGGSSIPSNSSESGFSERDACNSYAQACKSDKRDNHENGVKKEQTFGTRGGSARHNQGRQSTDKSSVGGGHTSRDRNSKSRGQGRGRNGPGRDGWRWPRGEDLRQEVPWGRQDSGPSSEPAGPTTLEVPHSGNYRRAFSGPSQPPGSEYRDRRGRGSYIGRNIDYTEGRGANHSNKHNRGQENKREVSFKNENRRGHNPRSRGRQGFSNNRDGRFKDSNVSIGEGYSHQLASDRHLPADKEHINVPKVDEDGFQEVVHR